MRRFTTVFALLIVFFTTSSCMPLLALRALTPLRIVGLATRMAMGTRLVAIPRMLGSSAAIEIVTARATAARISSLAVVARPRLLVPASNIIRLASSARKVLGSAEFSGSRINILDSNNKLIYYTDRRGNVFYHYFPNGVHFSTTRSYYKGMRLEHFDTEGNLIGYDRVVSEDIVKHFDHRGFELGESRRPSGTPDKSELLIVGVETLPESDGYEDAVPDPAVAAAEKAFRDAQHECYELQLVDVCAEVPLRLRELYLARSRSQS